MAITTLRLQSATLLNLNQEKQMELPEKPRRIFLASIPPQITALHSSTPRFRNPPERAAFYKQVANQLPENATTHQKLTLITFWIKTHGMEWGNILQWAKKNKKNYGYHRPRETFLDRSIEIGGHGNSFVHFNRTRLGDPICGKGDYKIAKFSMNLKTMRFCVRTTQTTTPEAIREATEFNQKIGSLRDSSLHVNYSTRQFPSKKEESRLETLSALYPLGDLAHQASVRGQRNLVEDTRIANSLISTVAVLHRNNLAHGDLHAGNIFFHRKNNIASPVIGDFGPLEVLNTCSPDKARSWKALDLHRLVHPIFTRLHPGIANDPDIAAFINVSLDTRDRRVVDAWRSCRPIPAEIEERNQVIINNWLNGKEKESHPVVRGWLGLPSMQNE